MTIKKTPTPKETKTKVKPKKKISNIIDFGTGEPIKLKAKTRGSIKNLNELNRFLDANKKGKIRGYVLAYIHEPLTKIDKELNGDDTYLFSYTVDGLNDAESLTKLYFWLDNVKGHIAETLMI